MGLMGGICVWKLDETGSRTVPLMQVKYLKMEHGKKFVTQFKGLPMVRGIDFEKILKSSTQRIGKGRKPDKSR
jgi:hypothetical protein